MNSGETSHWTRSPDGAHGVLAVQYAAFATVVFDRIVKDLMSEATQVVYIAGLSHSGSTLLHHLLSAHPRCVGLGEALRTIQSGPMGLERSLQRSCSCGKSMEDCPYWSQVVHALKVSSDTAVSYEQILSVFRNTYGPEKILVDSSKYIAPLKSLLKSSSARPKVLFLLKDVRAYAISQVDSARWKQETGHKPDIQQYSLWKHFRNWHAENQKIKQFLTDSRLDAMQLSYEELCLFREETVTKLYEFLGLDPHAKMSSLESANCHLVRGNLGVVRQQADGSQQADALQPARAGGIRVRYDHRWFYRSEWLLPAVFCRKVMAFNRQEVYSTAMEEVLGQSRGSAMPRVDKYASGSC